MATIFKFASLRKRGQEPWYLGMFKCWPVDLGVPGLKLLEVEVFPTVNGLPLQTAHHCHTSISLI